MTPKRPYMNSSNPSEKFGQNTNWEKIYDTLETESAFKFDSLKNYCLDMPSFPFEMMSTICTNKIFVRSTQLVTLTQPRYNLELIYSFTRCDKAFHIEIRKYFFQFSMHRRIHHHSASRLPSQFGALTFENHWVVNAERRQHNRQNT